MSALHVPEVDADQDTISAALAYAKHWYVVPVDRATKHPGSVLGKGWQHQSSRDAETIVNWFAGTDYALALHVGRSGAIAFDVDHPDQLPDVLAEAIRQTQPPFQSTRVDAPGRGHYLFAIPPGRALGNRQGKLGKTWGEVRGRNGVIVVAPSEHEKAADGGRYSWVRTGAVPVLPDAVAGLLPDAAEAEDAATDAEVKAFLERHTAGSRPELLNGIVGQFAAALAEGGSRHNAALLPTASVMREAAAGLYPAIEAAGRLRDMFVEATSRSRDGVERVLSPGAARAEFAGVLAWAVAQVKDEDVEAVRRRVAEQLPHDDENLADLLVEPPPRASSGDEKRDENTNGQPPPQRRSIDITDEPTAITGISDVINEQALPGTYVQSGRVVEITVPSGGVDDLVHIVAVTPDRLRRLLVRHVHVYRMKSTRTAEFPVPAAPAVSTCAAVLTDQGWPGLQPLAGLIHAPIIRPDGEVLQAPGYDEATGLYLTPRFPVPRVPSQPSPAEVAEAKTFLLDHVLGDFCFDSPASRANYIALLMTPMLRLYFGGMVPFGIVSATTRGSGKTLLVSVLNALYGAHMTTWRRDDEETAKVVTATLRDTTAPVVCFDNVDIHDTVDHPSLAMLLTSRTWSGRILGASSTFTAANDRLWMCTGNNVALGGDIASRSVLVKLDPQMERPELRTDFEIGDLDGWLHNDANRAELLRAVLTLARAWIAAGGPRIPRAMRNFSAWAQAMGGLTEFLDLPGFLGNEAELVDASDDEETSTAAFLAQWAGMYGSQPKRAVDLLDSARGDSVMGQWHDPWHGTFPARANGKPYSAKGLGRFLAARRGRIFGGLKLIGEMEPRTKVWLYRVERSAADAAAEAPAAA